MTNFLIKRFIKNDDARSLAIRQKYSTLSGSVGIFCNLLLAIFKFIIGLVTHSVSITADAANNLSDAGSNIVTIAGAKLANKPVDKEHPFGHGRMEYISALIVSFFIILMGFQLGKSSIDKIINPQQIEFNPVFIVILVAAIFVKLWMAYFNHRLYKITGNINMKAVRQDSLNDVVATSATILALVLSAFTSFHRADGIIGLVVAGIILIAGVKMVKEILDPILGQVPSEELVKGIEDIILAQENIVGVHDLIVHDYGPGRIIASAHAEVPSDMNILEIHDIIDNVEKQISRELNIMMCIHMDPIVVDDERVLHYKDFVSEILKEYNQRYSIHDFRVVDGRTHTNLIFDMVIPADHEKANAKILYDIETLIHNKDKTVFIVATIEHSYT